MAKQVVNIQGRRGKNVWRILDLLGRHGGLPFSRLKILTGLKKETLGKTLNRMRCKGLIARKDRPNSKSTYFLTPDGKSKWKKYSGSLSQLERSRKLLADLGENHGDLIALAYLVVQFEDIKAMDVLDHVGWKRDLPQKESESLDDGASSFWREKDGCLQFAFFTPPCYHIVVLVLEDDPMRLYLYCGLLGNDPLGVTNLARIVGPSTLVTLPFQHLLTLMCHLSWEASLLGHRTIVHECSLAEFGEGNFWGSTDQKSWNGILATFSRCTTKSFKWFPLEIEELEPVT